MTSFGLGPFSPETTGTETRSICSSAVSGAPRSFEVHSPTSSSILASIQILHNKSKRLEKKKMLQLLLTMVVIGTAVMAILKLTTSQRGSRSRSLRANVNLSTHCLGPLSSCRRRCCITCRGFARFGNFANADLASVAERSRI